MAGEPSEKGLVADDLITDARLDNAESDAFRHREIAGRVAELATTTRTPCNIALYGPWGSGKSSFCHLLTDIIERHQFSAKVIRYDAWKFGGHALKRNFISNAADELGIDTKPRERSASDFHGGLHQSTSSVALRPENVWTSGTLKSLLVYALLAAAVAVALSLGWAGIETWATETTFGAAFRNALRPIGTALLTAAGAVGLGVKIFESASVKVDRKAPSEDDQFDEVFGRLVKEGLKKSRKDTLVFFIDELDRCSKPDVVATLTSLRTFLDQTNCVFIVAADREVLEEALSALDQETPVRADEPYYSSASAFLDKIFQYQFTLPPLRSGRLTGFARSLVDSTEGGLWAELRSDDNEQTFDAVLYTLIPAHVRSPRRVKVLLNSYATNVRVAEARGVDWVNRATEIAKLTVLQVEFPGLAADLHLEPDLPTLLISKPSSLSPRQELLLHRHGAPADASAGAEEAETEGADDDQGAGSAENGVQTPDRLLAGNHSRQLRVRQYEDLIRYLESRAGVAPDPARDLVYLEIAGAVVGINDEELGRLVEDTAANDPQKVIERMAERPEVDRIAVAKALGRQSENEFGLERRNVITSLTGVVAGLHPSVLADDLGDLLKNLLSYLSDGELVPEQLAGALVIAVAAGRNADPLVSRIVDDDTFFDDSDNVEAASRMLPYLNETNSERVIHAVAELADERPDIAVEMARRESPKIIERFIQNAKSSLVTAFSVAEEDEPTPTPAQQRPQAAAAAPEPVEEPDASGFVTEFASTLLERGGNFVVLATSFAEMALKNLPSAYQSLFDLAPEVAGAATPDNGTDPFILQGLALADPSDWSHWSDLLHSELGSVDESANAVSAIVHAAWGPPADQTNEARKNAPSALAAVLGTRITSDDVDRAAWVPLLVEAEASSGVASDAEMSERELLFNLMGVAVAHDGDGRDLTARSVTSIVDGLMLSLTSAAALDVDTSGRFVALLDSLPAAALEPLRAAWREALTADLEINPQYCRVEIALVRELGRRTNSGETVRDEAVDNVVNAPFAAESIGQWLETQPGVDAIVAVLARVEQHARSLRPAVRSWAAGVAPDDRTSVMKSLFETSPKLDSLLIEVAAHDVDRAELAEYFATAMSEAPSKPVRQRVIDVVRGLPLQTRAETRPLVQQAHRMLSEGTSKAEVEAAAGLIAAVPGTHGMKGQIQSEIRRLEERDLVNNDAKRSFKNADYKIRSRGKRVGPLRFGNDLQG